MINDKITIVTSPDYDHNSDYKICLVGDTPLVDNILDLLDRDERRISVHCITKNDTDFDWIANTVNSSHFTFLDQTSELNKVYLGWILSRPNVYHNIEAHKVINPNYGINVVASLLKQTDSYNGGQIGI
jgi:hypothetical protein